MPNLPRLPNPEKPEHGAHSFQVDTIVLSEKVCCPDGYGKHSLWLEKDGVTELVVRPNPTICHASGPNGRYIERGIG